VTRVLIADKNYLSRVGLELLIGGLNGFDLVPSVCGDENDLMQQLQLSRPELLIIDHLSLGISHLQLKTLLSKQKKMRTLIITDTLSKTESSSVLSIGTNAYVLKECDKTEILEAINATINGQRFICGKIAGLLSAAAEIKTDNTFIKSLNCDGFSVTDREIEIIRHIALGLSNKQIADKLYLSTHTVNTHRRNLMNKLGVSNTAGVVMFAVKNHILEQSNYDLF
jgi:DNA-binding NarL/FixJ family response regulator